LIVNNVPLHPDNRRRVAYVHDHLYPGGSELMLSPFLVPQQVNRAQPLGGKQPWPPLQ
jgi:hypothetical protein